LQEREKRGPTNVALVRLEQIAPFAFDHIAILTRIQIQAIEALESGQLNNQQPASMPYQSVPTFIGLSVNQ